MHSIKWTYMVNWHSSKLCIKIQFQPHRECSPALDSTARQCCNGKELMLVLTVIGNTKSSVWRVGEQGFWTLMRRTSYVHNARCGVQNVECRANIAVLMQPPLKVWFSAGHYGHWFPVPKAVKAGGSYNCCDTCALKDLKRWGRAWSCRSVKYKIIFCQM